MPLTLDIAPELEVRLRGEAAERGLDVGEYVVSMLQEHLRQVQGGPHLLEQEARLLQRINEGLPSKTWQRYFELIDKRRAETMTPDEQERLIALSDQIEELNARRIEHLAQLARLRRTSLPELMQRLGIKAPRYG